MTDRYLWRELAGPVLRALGDMPVVVVTGMRQVGKTTMLRREPALRQRRYVSLDDFATLEAARRSPETFVGGPDPMTIDEIQRCPDLLLAIKRHVDGQRAPGRYLLSGSASLDLAGAVSESLAGRALYLTMRPFTRREIQESTRKEPFLVGFFRSPRLPGRTGSVDPVEPGEVTAGGLPPVVAGGIRDAEAWFRGFEQTYLERDVRALAQVADLVSFRQIAILASLRTGQILNASELARDARLTAATASRYLGIMESSFLVRRLTPFLGNRASRLIKSPKVFVSDSGLACHMAGIETLGPSSDEPLRGAMLETWVASNLSAILESWMPRASLHFWSVQGRHEVDFVVESGRDSLAMEVKWATRWGGNDLSGLKAFLGATPRCRAAILAHNGTDAVHLGDRLWALPLGLLLS